MGLNMPVEVAVAIQETKASLEVEFTPGRFAAEGIVPGDADSGTTILLRAAFRRTRDHWLAITDDARFRSAVGAVMLLVDEGQRGALEAEVRDIAKASEIIQAMAADVPVDWEALAAYGERWAKPRYGLLRLWEEAKGG